MKLLRPYIPVAVRVQVAERQLLTCDPLFIILDLNEKISPLGRPRLDAFAGSVQRGDLAWETHDRVWIASLQKQQLSPTRYLEKLLAYMFYPFVYHLDHDPALENRPFNPRTKKYTPDANDPEFLIYRTKEDHRIKTLVRGDGAQLSDAAIARKRKRKERKARRPKTRWPSRPLRSASRWPKRKMR